MRPSVCNITLYSKNQSKLYKAQHSGNVIRADKFVPQYMGVSDQASHSICSICTHNHELVVFYDTLSLVIFCYCPSNIFSCNSLWKGTTLAPRMPNIIYTGRFLISVPCSGINGFLVFWSWRPEILRT